MRSAREPMRLSWLCKSAFQSSLMRGLVHEKGTGRRLRDVLPLPAVLAQAILRQQQLADEELVFDTVRGRAPCLCSLKAISSYRPETGLETIVSSPGLLLSEPV